LKILSLDQIKGTMIPNVCGRYYSLFDKQQVAEHFHVRRTADSVGIIAPNWNVDPGDPQPVIRRSRDTGEREFGHILLHTPDEDKAERKARELLSTHSTTAVATREYRTIPINSKSPRLSGGFVFSEVFTRSCCRPGRARYHHEQKGLSFEERHPYR
jgi:hypothetical protein